MWIWTVMRKAKYTHVLPEGANPMAVMAGIVSSEHKYESHTDHAALINVEEGAMVYEVVTHESGAPPCILYVPSMGSDAIMLADTLDEFAAKVGASPRPRVEVPTAFNRFALGDDPE